MLVLVVLRLASNFLIADLPFIPRPPRYIEYIAQLFLGAICLRISLNKASIADRTGQFYFNRGLLRVALLVLGVLAIVFGIAGFVLDRFRV